MIFALVLATASPVTVHVAAASNVQSALDEIVAVFESKHPDVDIRVSYGSSGSFYAQLTKKAPFELFLSADTEYPQKLVDAGLADPAFPYALGRLVVWTPKGNQPGVAALKAAKKVAIANPRVAPYGRAAEEALSKLGLHDVTRGKLVLGENIAQTAQFAQSGAADAAFIALSTALMPAMQSAGSHWEVPGDAYAPIVQAGCTMKSASASARKLAAFILGDEARAIFTKHGYAQPGTSTALAVPAPVPVPAPAPAPSAPRAP